MKRRTHLAPRLPTLLAWLSLMLAPACSCRQTNEVAPLPPKAEGPALAGLQGPPPSVAGVPAGLLLPPATPGDSRVAITGCLAEADEAGGARHPVAVTRSAPATPEVTVSALGNGLIVAHDLAHACCLKGEVEARVEGTTVRVIETLSGSPCRCMCHSTLKTAVALVPGDYTVEVVVKDGFGEKTVTSRSIRVGSPR
jgi:hypothetical protein